MAKDGDSNQSLITRYLKTIGISILAVFFALTLTGCGKRTTETSDQRELVVWGFFDEDVFKPIIESFEKKNKITVTYVKKELNKSYESDALNSIMSGQGPDVWAIPNDWVYRHKEKLAPLPENIIKANELDVAATFADFVQQDNIIDGKVYGLTPGVDILKIYYNSNLFYEAQERAKLALKSQPETKKEISNLLEKVPATWEEFNKIIPWLTVKNGNDIVTSAVAMGTSNNVSYSEDILSLLMLQNQTQMVSDDLNQSTFNLPIKNSIGQEIFSGANALEFYTSFANPASPNYTWNSSMPNDIQAFVEGKVAMIFNYSSLEYYLSQFYPNFKYRTALVPQIDNFNPIVDFASYTTYVAPEISPLSEYAWKFIVQLSTEFYETYNSATLTLQPFKTDQSITLAERRDKSRPGKTEVATAKTWIKGRFPLEVDTLFRDAISRVNSRSQNSQASLDTAATRTTELLRKRDW